MAYALAVGSVAFAVALLLGQPIVAQLVRLHIGKRIREEGPERHAAKAGTPTMGGIIIFASTVLTTIPFNLSGQSITLPLATMVSSGAIGGFDDMLSLVGGSRQGMTGRLKMGLLLAVAIVATAILFFAFQLRSIYVPFAGKFDIGLFYLPIAIFIIVGSAHAVNLTDGLDTLAGGTAALAFASYGIIAFLQGQQFLTTFCFTVAGATLGFLWYNAHPAQVFMGDTGSLALGATLGVCALMTGQWLLLPLVGAVFVIEAGSVILQVAYFKWTHGKRLLRMSPIHHHFELLGWSEPQVTMRFWLVGMLASMLGVSLALA